MADLLNEFETEIESITVIPSTGGRFEVSVDGELLYSKLSTHRHAEPGEIPGLLRGYLAKNSS